MIRKNGRMLYEDMVLNEGENKIIEERCYKSNHRGDIIVQARIKEKYKAKSRTNNMIKLAREVSRAGLRMRGIKNCEIALADIRFENIIDANKCLNLGEDREDSQVKYSIPNRIMRIKGVISDWDCSVPIYELAEAMDNKEGLIQMERMKRRFIDKETKESRIRLTNLIIVTYEGTVLAEAVTLFDGVIRLRIRPFMEPVRYGSSALDVFSMDISRDFAERTGNVWFVERIFMGNVIWNRNASIVEKSK